MISVQCNLIEPTKYGINAVIARCRRESQDKAIRILPFRDAVDYDVVSKDRLTKSFPQFWHT
jgi:hypothetical protein